MKSNTSTPTVSRIFEEWLAEQKDHMKESTYVQYRHMIMTHILPELGKIPIDNLQESDINNFLKAKQKCGKRSGKGGLSPKSVMDLRSVLLLGLGDHISFQHLYAPHVQVKQIQIFTTREQETLEQYIYRHMDSCNFAVLLCMYTGLRIGELCALQWGDIQIQDRLLNITKTLMRIQKAEGFDENFENKTKILITPPKTEKSIRTIPLPEFLIPLAEQYKSDNSFFVLTNTKKPMEPRTCSVRYAHLLERAGIPHHTFHALRHTFATRCVENGVDVKTLSEILGHSDVTITLQRYVHPTLEQKKKELQKLPHSSIWESSFSSNEKLK